MKINKLYLLLIFTLLATFSQAEENYLNIDATNFEANEQKQIMYFSGNVKMTKNNDILKCETLHINTEISTKDSSKQTPKDYKAIGDVSFTFYTQDSIMHGKGDVVYYYPKKKKYIIEGNGYLEDTKNGKKITANKIYVDEATGLTKIDGQVNKPIKFRLKLDK